MSSESGTPLISIIIPTLNEEKLLPQILSQFTPELKNKYNFEVIISDGGSTDNSLSIAKGYNCIITENNSSIKQSISEGRNTGALKASGELFIFFNADTIINNIYLFFESVINSFQNEDIVAVTCNIKVFKSEQKYSDKIFHNIFNLYIRELNFLGIGMGRGECHCIRRSAFQKVNGYNNKLIAGEDFDLFRRLSHLGKIKFLKELTIYESPRRYRKYGYISVLGDWTLNSLSVLFRNKSISKEWDAVR